MVWAETFDKLTAEVQTSKLKSFLVLPPRQGQVRSGLGLSSDEKDVWQVHRGVCPSPTQ